MNNFFYILHWPY